MKSLKTLRVMIIGFIIGIASIMLVPTAYSSPAFDMPMEVEQPDGIVLELFASGDSFFNYLHDSNGRVIVQHPRTGFWVYAGLDEDGLLVATNQIVADDGYFYFSHQLARIILPISSQGITTDDIDFSINSHLIWEREEGIYQGIEVSSERTDSRFGVVRTNPIEGQIENIVITIAFYGEDSVIPQSTWNRIENSFDLTGEFVEIASGGVATLNTTFLIGSEGNNTTIIYQDPNPRSYFMPYHPVTNPNGYCTSQMAVDPNNACTLNRADERGEREQALLARAVEYVDGNPALDGLGRLDTIREGFIDSVTFFVMGMHTPGGGLLWPHKWSLFSEDVYLNGVRVWDYSFVLEGSSLGAIIHEQLHVFSFPDFHRGGGTPVGAWDIMSTVGRRALPNTHTNRRYVGWGDAPVEIVESGRYTLSPLGTTDTPHSTAYVIPMDNRTGEFILIEYRNVICDNGFNDFTGIGEYAPGIIISRINPQHRGNSVVNPNLPTPIFRDEVYVFRPGETVRNAGLGHIQYASLSADVGRTYFGRVDGTGYDGIIYRADGLNSGIVIYDVSYVGDTISFRVSVNMHDVTLDFDGAHDEINLVVNHGNTIDLTDIPVFQFQRENGDTFVGWQANGTGPVLTRQQLGEFSIRESVTFYAVWEQITQWQQLRTHISNLPPGEHVVRLSQNINTNAGAVGSAISISGGRHITLACITASCTLTQPNAHQRHFTIGGGGGGSLTLESGIVLSGGEPGNANNSGGVHVQPNTTFTMEDGSVIENNRRTSGNGGAVMVGDALSPNAPVARFYMNGGVIRNNTAFSGGGIYLRNNAIMTMEGGYIENNMIIRNPAVFGSPMIGGGGVLANGGSAKLVIAGGYIQNNYADAVESRGIAIGNGGGVLLINNANFEMSGGVIQGNNANVAGGGVAVGATSIFGTSSGTFIMSGGKIYDNATTGSIGGGGIFQGGDSRVTISGGIISHNVANSGGGVRVNTTATNAFTMTGGTISHNRATNGGGIFTAQNNRLNINIGANVNFSHNTASNGAFMPPSNAETANIAITATRSGGFWHPLNNLDINLTTGTRVNLHLVHFLDGDSELDSFAVHQGGQLIEATIPIVPDREGYQFMGWSRTPDGEVESLIGQTITGTTDFFAIWQPVREINVCPVIVTEGQFADQEGENGLVGSKWRLCEGGLLEIDSGFINHNRWRVAPWNAYRSRIERIVITGPVEGGDSLANLFGWLSNLVSIEGLEQLNTSNVTYMSWMFGDLTLTTLDLSNWDTSNVTDMSGMFGGASSVTSLDLSDWDVSNVTDMSGMFRDMSSLTTLDLSNWDTSNVTTMLAMFGGMSSLTTLDLSNWDTSNVTTMSEMFWEASSLTSLDLSNWDTSNVTTMSGMFSYMSGLTTLDLSNWDTSNVTTMSGMFSYMSSLSSLDLSSFDTRGMEDLWNKSEMFNGMESLRELTLGEHFELGTHLSQDYRFSPALPLIERNDVYSGYWQAVGSGTTENPTGAFIRRSRWSSYFDGILLPETFVWERWGDACPTIHRGQLDGDPVSGLQGASWRLCENGTLEVGGGFMENTGRYEGSMNPWSSWSSAVSRIVFTEPIIAGEDLAYIFAGFGAIEGLELIDTSHVTDMSGMFAGTFLTELDLSAWDTSNVRYMREMFADTSLIELDLSAWDISNVTDMMAMFAGTSLTELDLSTWDISGVTYMGNMFNGANITSLDLSNWDIRNVECHWGIFRYAHLITLNLSNWNTSHVTDMSRMFMWEMFGFGGDMYVANLDLSGWDTSNVRYMIGMFRDMYMTNLDLSGWDTSNVVDMRGMFRETWYLTNLDLSGWDTSNVTSMAHMFDSTGLISVDLSHFNTSAVTIMFDMFRDSSLESLDLSGWDISAVTNMDRMFRETPNLRSLDLSGWDTSNVTDMWWMFYMNPLRELTLGDQFRFRSGVTLPAIEQTNQFTGYWQNVGSGTVDNPQGEFVFTSAQLTSQFNGATMADTWVWQPVR